MTNDVIGRKNRASDRLDYVTDPYIDEIILHRPRRMNREGHLLVEPIITSYEVFRKIDGRNEKVTFRCEVIPSRTYGVGTPRVYDVLHCLLDLWRREGYPTTLTVSPIRKIRDILNYTHTDTIVENIRALAHYSIFMDGVWDREEGILYKTDNLSPFLRSSIYMPKYSKLGGRIEVEFNPKYISYMEKNYVYLDFNIADLYKKIPPSAGDSRRAVFTLSKLHNVGQQKGSKEIEIDTTSGHMFAEVFQLGKISRTKEADIKRIFTPIREKLGYISNFTFYPKENMLVCTKGKKVVKEKKSSLQGTDVAANTSTVMSDKIERVINMAKVCLKRHNYNPSLIEPDATEYPYRVITISEYIDRNPDSIDRPAAFINGKLHKYELGSWDDIYLQKIKTDVTSASEKVSKVNSKIEQYGDVGRAIAEVVTKYESIGIPQKDLKKLMRYVFGRSAVEIFKESDNKLCYLRSYAP